MVKLSVVVPVYNVQAYVLDCLWSLEGQRFDSMEVIVVDDGSTDESGVMAEAFCRGKERFRFFRKKNGGLMSAWTYGVEQAVGEYIGFVDSDDFVSADMYTVMMKTAMDTDADIVMCDHQVVTHSGIRQAKGASLKAFYDETQIKEIHNRVFPSLKGGNISSARWNKIFKREVFFENLKYCTEKSRYCEDRYIVPACLLTARSFSYVERPLYNYRMRKTANSKSPSVELVPSLDQLYCTQLQMLRDKGLEREYKDKLDVARINYIKLAYERNLVNARGVFSKYPIAKQILAEDKRAIVLDHREECVHKFGNVLFLAARLNCPWILILSAVGSKLLIKNEIADWYA